MTLTTRCCPKCNSENHKPHTTYTVGDGEKRQIHHCSECGEYFSDTKNTPLEGLKKPLSCYRRKTNTSLPDVSPLQTRLDGQWVLHNRLKCFNISNCPEVRKLV